jgi:hypothetical protein
MTPRRQVAVTMRALVQRINRQLKKDQEVLKATRGAQARLDLGAFYRLDWNRNLVLETDVDPEAMGRKLGVLQPYERVVEDS